MFPHTSRFYSPHNNHKVVVPQRNFIFVELLMVICDCLHDQFEATDQGIIAQKDSNVVI